VTGLRHPRCIACIGCSWSCREAPCGDPGDEHDGDCDGDARHLQVLPLPRPETIERAAIYFDTVIYSVPRPGRHHHVFQEMHDKHNVESHDGHVQGFVTSRGRFVDRREAVVIARACGQIRVKTQPEYELFSEDVW
jgi:hypothetical protein